MVLLITDVLFGTAATVIVTAAEPCVTFAVLWYAIPLRRKASR